MVHYYRIYATPSAVSNPYAAKLAAYGFDSYSLSFVFTYLIERNKEHKYIIATVPTLIKLVEFCKGQYKVLFFSTLACSTCFFEKYECDIASYTDDSTPCTNDSDLYTCTLVLSKFNKCTDFSHFLRKFI